MKNIVFIISLLFSFHLLQAQGGSWKIKLNNKTLIATSEESETTNTKKIVAAEWKKSGSLEILFTEAEKNTWIRSFLFYDNNENEILRKDSAVQMKISVAELKRLFAGKKEIIIYTTIAPVNPMIAIRIRRVHLCTLKLP